MLGKNFQKNKLLNITKMCFVFIVIVNLMSVNAKKCDETCEKFGGRCKQSKNLLSNHQKCECGNYYSLVTDVFDKNDGMKCNGE